MVKIGERSVGTGYETFIIAELSANHNQNFDLAVKTIEAIKESGADAVKIQTYKPETLTLDCNNDMFQRKTGLWKGYSLFDVYKKAYTPWEWHADLKKIADELGLIFFSSPFDKEAVDLLENLDVPAYKVASLEITDIPLIEYIASKGKPIIFSTGIARLRDIEEAIDACRRMSNRQIALLKCTTAYPTPFEEINLRTIPNMKEVFDTVVGISDHTLGFEIAVAAVTLGASIVEKHFVLDRKLQTPDSSFSMEPKEFKKMVSSIRNVEKALGSITYELSKSSMDSRQLARSLFISKDVKSGEFLTMENVKSIRPGNGLHPRYLKKILGWRVVKDIKAGTPLTWDVLL